MNGFMEPAASRGGCRGSRGARRLICWRMRRCSVPAKADPEAQTIQKKIGSVVSVLLCVLCVSVFGVGMTSASPAPLCVRCVFRIAVWRLRTQLRSRFAHQPLHEPLYFRALACTGGRDDPIRAIARRAVRKQDCQRSVFDQPLQQRQASECDTLTAQRRAHDLLVMVEMNRAGSVKL